jgi:hypothetical protein
LYVEIVSSPHYRKNLLCQTTDRAVSFIAHPIKAHSNLQSAAPAPTQNPVDSASPPSHRSPRKINET